MKLHLGLLRVRSFLVFFVVLGAFALWADTIQISALSPEPSRRSGEIFEVQITPDDQYVVFVSASPYAPGNNGRPQLYVTFLSSAEVSSTRINRPLMGSKFVDPPPIQVGG